MEHQSRLRMEQQELLKKIADLFQFQLNSIHQWQDGRLKVIPYSCNIFQTYLCAIHHYAIVMIIIWIIESCENQIPKALEIRLYVFRVV